MFKKLFEMIPLFQRSYKELQPKQMNLVSFSVYGQKNYGHPPNVHSMRLGVKIFMHHGPKELSSRVLLVWKFDWNERTGLRLPTTSWAHVPIWKSSSSTKTMVGNSLVVKKVKKSIFCVHSTDQKVCNLIWAPRLYIF